MSSKLFHYYLRICIISPFGKELKAFQTKVIYIPSNVSILYFSHQFVLHFGIDQYINYDKQYRYLLQGTEILFGKTYSLSLGATQGIILCKYVWYNIQKAFIYSYDVFDLIYLFTSIRRSSLESKASSDSKYFLNERNRYSYSAYKLDHLQVQLCGKPVATSYFDMSMGTSIIISTVKVPLLSLAYHSGNQWIKMNITDEFWSSVEGGGHMGMLDEDVIGGIDLHITIKSSKKNN